jgi:hypothetical protein
MRATWQGTRLLLSSVEQGDVTHVDPIAPEMVLGEIAWSPTNTALVYLLTEFDCYPWGKTYLVHVDLSTSGSRILLESASPSFAWVQWSERNRLHLQDQDDIQWTYDLVTGGLTMSK